MQRHKHIECTNSPLRQRWYIALSAAFIVVICTNAGQWQRGITTDSTLRSTIGAELFGVAAGQLASDSSTSNDAGSAIYLLDVYESTNGLQGKVNSKLKMKEFEESGFKRQDRST